MNKRAGEKARSKDFCDGLLKSANGNQPGNTYPISVNYTRTLADMIKAGKYDWVNNKITEKNFPI